MAQPKLNLQHFAKGMCKEKRSQIQGRAPQTAEQAAGETPLSQWTASVMQASANPTDAATGDQQIQPDALRQLPPLQQTSPEQTFPVEAARSIVQRVAQESQGLQQMYPNFDLGRELKNPRFARLVARGVDARTAYEAAHQQELLQNAYRMGQDSRSAQIAGAVMGNRSRPPENGTAGSGVVTDIDPRGLSKTQRADIRARVRRGEKIKF